MRGLSDSGYLADKVGCVVNIPARLEEELGCGGGGAEQPPVLGGKELRAGQRVGRGLSGFGPQFGRQHAKQTVQEGVPSDIDLAIQDLPRDSLYRPHPLRLCWVRTAPQTRNQCLDGSTAAVELGRDDGKSRVRTPASPAHRIFLRHARHRSRALDRSPAVVAEDHLPACEVQASTGRALADPIHHPTPIAAFGRVVRLRGGR